MLRGGIVYCVGYVLGNEQDHAPIGLFAGHQGRSDSPRFVRARLHRGEKTMKTRKLRLILLGCVAAMLAVWAVYGIAFKTPQAGVNQDRLQQVSEQSSSDTNS